MSELGEPSLTPGTTLIELVQERQRDAERLVGGIYNEAVGINIDAATLLTAKLQVRAQNTAVCWPINCPAV